MNTKADILVADDEINIRRSLENLLSDAGYGVIVSPDAGGVFKAVESGSVDLVILDLFLGEDSGIEILRRLKRLESSPPVIMISGRADIGLAVEAVKLGARDFLEKPLEPERLLVTIGNVLKLTALERENIILRRRAARKWELVGRSKAMAELREKIARFARTSVPVLITGPSGSGKELVARNLHLLSDRAGQPFVAVNCGSIPREMAESELFGHAKGAFTGAIQARKGKFAMADGGSLFLDELVELDAAVQAKLLRILDTGLVCPLGSDEERPVDVRLVAATNADIDRSMEDGSLRSDLFYRLSVAVIAVPPLDQRKEDIPELARRFLTEACFSYGLPEKGLSARAIQLLMQRQWPGNVRELRNIVERAAIISGDEEVDAYLDPQAEGMVIDDTTAGDSTLSGRMTAFERAVLTQALDQADGNIALAARNLGMDRANLSRKLKKHGIVHRPDRQC